MYPVSGMLGQWITAERASVGFLVQVCYLLLCPSWNLLLYSSPPGKLFVIADALLNSLFFQVLFILISPPVFCEETVKLGTAVLGVCWGTEGFDGLSCLSFCSSLGEALGLSSLHMGRQYSSRHFFRRCLAGKAEICQPYPLCLKPSRQYLEFVLPTCVYQYTPKCMTKLFTCWVSGLYPNLFNYLYSNHTSLLFN